LSYRRSIKLKYGTCPSIIMDPPWIAILLILPMVAGCIVEEDVPEPKDGDLELTISYPESEFYPGQVNVPITITLRNICDHDVLVDDAFSFGTTLFPMARASNGSEVILSYPLIDRQPHYGRFSPGETKQVSESLDPERIVIDGGEIDFDWDIPDTYSISVEWRGVEKTDLNITSNLFPLTVGDYLDPVEGDLSFTIFMDNYEYSVEPELLYLSMELKNVCDHPVKVAHIFGFGSTLWPECMSSDGWEIEIPILHYDFNPQYSPLYPSKTLVSKENISGPLRMIKGEERKEFSWDIAGIYMISVTWWGVEYSNFNVTSNEIAITIR
jgi:hypothetical protein